MAGKTLVAYATKGGATEEAANLIADVLGKKHKIEADVLDLRKEKPDVSGYSKIVAGAGVRAGKIYREFWELLENRMEGKKLAFFIVCGEAGDPKDHDRVLEKHLKAILSRHPNFQLTEFEVFGGRMKILGRVLHDSFDSDKIRKWAEKVGKKFTS